MNKLYFVFILVHIISKSLYSQSAIEAVETPDSRFQFVNKNTRVKVNDLVWDETEPFVNGFAKVAAGHRWGLVDKFGNPIIKADFESVRNFVNNLAAVKQNSKWGFIDEKGKTIIPFDYDIVYDFKELVTAVYKNNKWFLINRKGAVIKPLDIDIFWGFKNGMARITRQGLNGLMNTSGVITSIEPGNKILPKKTNKTANRNNAVQAAPCPDNIGFENGNFTNWNSFIGTVAAVGADNVITVDPSAPTDNRHVIYAASNPSDLDPYGLFPITPPDGSGFALKLGNNVNGAEAERVTYQINVPANSADASITYRYAVVFQDPGHLVYQQPRFSAKLLDVQTNTYLPCASYEYVSDDALPGFYNSTIDDSVKCKAWASVFINLSAYAGRTLILEFTTADCTRGAHWGYTYVDVGDCNISADIQYQCNPSMATLAAPPGFANYKWWNNNYSTQIGTGQNVILTPAPALNSILHVEVIPANGAGCSDTLNVVVTNNTPTANAGPDKTICAGMSASIGTSAVNGNTYSWSPVTFLSDPNIANPTSTATVSTTYILSVSNTANGCTVRDTVNVIVNPTPTALFDPSADQCLTGNSYSFTNNSTVGQSYNWSFGDGVISTQTNPVHSYKIANTYPVKLVVTNNYNCTDTSILAVTVFTNTILVSSKDVAICRGSSYQLQSSGAQTYEWAPAQGLSCTDCANPVATPLTTTSYIVKGNNNLGCPAIDTVVISVHQPIQVIASGGTSICKDQPANIFASGATTYLWSPAQSLSNAAIANPVATPDTTTQYRVVGFDGNNCFTDTAYVTISVIPNPIVLFDPEPDQCLAGNQFTFTNNSAAGLSFNWNFGDDGTSTQRNPAHIYTNAQSYPVKLVATNSSGCKDSITHTVTLHENPIVKTNNDLSICRGNSVQLQATGAQMYEWTPTQYLSCSDCANPDASPLTNTTYIVKGTNSFGCPGYDTVAITVFQPIQVNVSPGGTICEKQSINLWASGAASYIWTPATSLSSSVIANPVATPPVTTQYRVVGFDGNNCFTDTGFVSITVNPKPSIELGPDKILSTGTIYPLNPKIKNGPIVSWQWTPSTNLSCASCPDPSATIKTDITYHALIKNNYGCTATDSINIKTFCEGTQVFIPNAFTPDGDGINDILMVRATGIQAVRSFRIFTRWGELIFEKNNFSPNIPTLGWDGKIRGVTGPAEVYVYTAEVTCDNLQTYIYKGNVSILK